MALQLPCPTQMALQVLFLTLIISIAFADQFTALVDLERTLQAEGKIANLLQDYVEKEYERLEKIQEVANSMEHFSQEGLTDPIKVVGNPISAFQLVKRLTAEWNTIKETLILYRNTDLESELEVITHDFPDYEDYQGSADALLRLQDTYALDPDDISHGVLPGVVDSPLMSAHDCYELARIAYEARDYYHTIQWAEQALIILDEEEIRTVDEATVLGYLEYSLYLTGNVHHARTVVKRWLELEPWHERAMANLNNYENLIEQQGRNGNKSVPEEYHNPRPDPSSDYFNTYEALCRGEEVFPVKNKHKLTCQYRRWHPMFYINPLREETMNFEPWVAVYHQLMSDHEIEKIKELATPRLQRASIYNSETGKSEQVHFRVSKSAWLQDWEDPIIDMISQRCSALTNLSLSTVEQLQVVNYGIGGHFEPHFDFLNHDNSKPYFDLSQGDRILTVIFYMSDVESGGGTSFIDAGITNFPEKGSAAVWWNLLASGQGDRRTRHAGCPVLVGSKWVANKWFHERGQEFNRPCDLEP